MLLGTKYDIGDIVKVEWQPHRLAYLVWFKDDGTLYVDNLEEWVSDSPIPSRKFRNQVFLAKVNKTGRLGDTLPLKRHGGLHVWQ